MAKRKLHLVTDKQIKKVYEIVTVFLIDESVYTFDLGIWDIITSDREWLQFIKTDDSAMECFYTNNIVRVLFDHKAGKKEESPLKPVA